MSENKNFRAGVIIIILVLIIVLGFVWLKDIKVNHNSYLLNAKFKNIGTLQVGDPVIANGERVGSVKKMFLIDTNICVQMQFRKLNNMPRGSEIMLDRIGLMGERAIKITLSNNSESYLSNDTMENVIENRNVLGENIKSFSEVINYPVTISEKLDSIIVLLNEQNELMRKKMK